MTSKTNESAKHPLYLAGVRDGRAEGWKSAIAECVRVFMTTSEGDMSPKVFLDLMNHGHGAKGDDDE